MHRTKLLTLLEKYEPLDDTERAMTLQVIEFIKRVPDCFENTYPEGHVTAAAWILDPDTLKTGLVQHKKLNKWIQPGGHSDGNSNTPQEALREAKEEFGITSLELYNEEIFDIDVHFIPEDIKRGLGKHKHFDIRSLVIGDSNIPPMVSNESHDAKWIDIDRVPGFNNSETMQRLLEKTKKFLITKKNI